MYQDQIKQKKGEFDAVLEFARHEAASIRTGRATTSMVEDLAVDYYGSRMTIKELASISVPEPRSLVMQPWDKGALSAIEKAIRDSSIGLNPVVDGTSVRLNIPPLTEERRKEFTRLLGQKIEEARIRIRQVREEVLRKVQQDDSAREDDMHKAKEELQKIVDDLNSKLDEIKKKKESEIMTL